MIELGQQHGFRMVLHGEANRQEYSRLDQIACDAAIHAFNVSEDNNASEAAKLSAANAATIAENAFNVFVADVTVELYPWAQRTPVTPVKCT